MKWTYRLASIGCLMSVLALLPTTSLFAQTATGTISGKLINPWLTRNATMVVYIETVPGGSYPAPERPPTMNQVSQVYTPHVLPTVAGWGVQFQNEDPFLHNVHAYLEGTNLFNVAIPPVPNFKLVRPFNEEGIVNLLCDVHQEMSAFILVLQNPYFAVLPRPDAQAQGGKPEFAIALRPYLDYLAAIPGQALKSEANSPEAEFIIKDVPPGSYQLKVWGEKLKEAQLRKTFPVVVRPDETTQVELKP